MIDDTITGTKLMKIRMKTITRITIHHGIQEQELLGSQNVMCATRGNRSIIAQTGRIIKRENNI